MLSHPEQLDRLAGACPQAVPAAVVAGDPCFDRMLASRPLRERYRRAFGASAGRRLVVVSSTWGRHSLFGRRPELLRGLLAELPVDEYAVVAALHPNIVHAHGRWQVRAWLADCLRAGLTLLPPVDGWRAALVAADCVIGDHGSVTFYAAALGVPVLLAAFATGRLDAGSPIAALGRAAPRLRPDVGLRAQVDAAVAEHAPDRLAAVTAATTSLPLGSAAALRGLVYRLMGLPEPDRPAVTLPLPVPRLDGQEPPHASAVFATAELSVPGGGGRPVVAVTRLPADVAVGRGRAEADSHLVVAEDGSDPGLLELADVVTGRAAGAGAPGAWAAEVLRRLPGCEVAVLLDAGGCVAVPRSGAAIGLRTAPPPGGAGARPDPAVLASAVYAWIADGRDAAELAPAFTVRAGTAACEVAVTLASGALDGCEAPVAAPRW